MLSLVKIDLGPYGKSYIPKATHLTGNGNKSFETDYILNNMQMNVCLTYPMATGSFELHLRHITLHSLKTLTAVTASKTSCIGKCS